MNCYDCGFVGFCIYLLVYKIEIVEFLCYFYIIYVEGVSLEECNFII